jgi:hypothetical protein
LILSDYTLLKYISDFVNISFGGKNITTPDSFIEVGEPPDAANSDGHCGRIIVECGCISRI